MKWSIKLAKLLGIDVYLHFTFLLLLAFLGFTYWRATQNLAATLQGVAFIVALFGCVEEDVGRDGARLHHLQQVFGTGFEQGQVADVKTGLCSTYT